MVDVLSGSYCGRCEQTIQNTPNTFFKSIPHYLKINFQQNIKPVETLQSVDPQGLL